MENSYKYFKNTKCKYFPCHKGMEGQEFNCLFCYCPMNPYRDCLGTPAYKKRKDNHEIKDCTNCNFPHKPENYEAVIKFLSDKIKNPQ